MILKKKSISYRLLLWILVIIIPITLFIVFENLYAINVVRNQVSISNQGTLNLYVNQIQETLLAAENYLANLTYRNEIITASSTGIDEYEFYMQSQLLLTEVTSAKMVYPQIDGFFVVDRTVNQIIKKTNSAESVEEIEEMRSYFLSLSNLQDEVFDGIRGKWFAEEFIENHFLFRVYRTDKYVIGAWINLKHLLKPLKSSEYGGDKYFALADQENGVFSKEIYSTEDGFGVVGDTEKYLVIQQKFDKSDLYLIALIREKGVLEGLDTLQVTITIISFLSLLLIPTSIYLIRKTVIRPMKNIVTAMDSARSGNLDAQIKEVPEYTEYQIVKDSFRDMLQQIRSLKIDVYEEQISKQKAKLQYYQLQINPHFVMNALNMIYNLSEVKKYQIIQEMTLALVKYYRSMLSMSKFERIDLYQEIDFVNHYLSIQSLRFPNKMEHHIDIEEGVEYVPVPPIVIQTFVENSIKYAADDEKILVIHVKVSRISENLMIVISDNGDGFTQEFLDRYKNWENLGENIEQVGIQNVIHRLQLLYPNRFNICFHNLDSGGAVVEIQFPITELTRGDI